jgi:NAD(P)-dependent dehydrogenase (short-subunit alcohol dehydrogenase family)
VAGRFDGKVVLITGAASGIGRATALRIAEEGGAVFLTDVQQNALEQVAKEAAAFGVDAVAHVADVSDPVQCRGSVEACSRHFGRLDALINVAGILRMTHTRDVSIEEWNLVLQVNLSGTFFMCQAALPHLLEAQGNIVNTSSTAALAGTAYAAAYAASKGGVLALTHTLAVEYGKEGLRVNAVCPGSIKTPMASRSKLPENMDFELIRRVMALDKPRGPETVSGVIAFLASDDAAHVNGEAIRVDGATLS